MPRTVLMGDPTHFSVRGGANPHTRDVLGRRKRVDAALARRQWHNMARTLIAHGVEVCVIEPHARLSGLVYPANAGFLYPLEGARGEEKTFHVAHLLPTRAAEREVYRRFIASMGYATSDMRARHEGEADFFPAGRFMVFTYGRIERQRFVMQWGIPPWRRVYGFRSEIGALAELRQIVRDREILGLELSREAHYHGDTVFCSFGPNREYLLAYVEGLTDESRARVRGAFGPNLIELGPRDAALYAANSFQTDYDGKLYLFMPDGISDGLQRAVQEREVEPVTVDVSEFLAKGGGSVKCMILDLGPQQEQPEVGRAFRGERSYKQLFGERESDTDCDQKTLRRNE
jgi:N-dimethylarginine dimethylaminohydrolase